MPLKHLYPEDESPSRNQVPRFGYPFLSQDFCTTLEASCVGYPFLLQRFSTRARRPLAEVQHFDSDACQQSSPHPTANWIGYLRSVEGVRKRNVKQTTQQPLRSVFTSHPAFRLTGLGTLHVARPEIQWLLITGTRASCTTLSRLASTSTNRTPPRSLGYNPGRMPTTSWDGSRKWKSNRRLDPHIFSHP